MTRSDMALFLAAWCALFVFVNPGFPWFETPSYETMLTVAREGALGSPVPLTTLYKPAPDGQFYELHDYGSTFLAMPVGWATIRALSWAGTAPTTRQLAFVGGFLGPVAMALALLAFFLIQVRFCGCRRRAAFLTTAALGLGTQLLVYSAAPTDGTVATTLLAWVFYGWLTFWEAPRGGAIAAAFGLAAAAIVTRITTAAVPAVLLLALVFSRRLPIGERLRYGVIAAAVLLPAVAFVLYFNALRTGSIFDSPTAAPPVNEFDPRFYPESLPGSIFSPAKGLLAFNPALVLAPIAIVRLWPVMKRELVVILTIYALTLARLPGMLDWTSAGGWGPRHYTYLIPLLFLPVAVWLGRAAARGWSRIALVLTLAGALVNLSGMLVNWHYRQTWLGVQSPWALVGQPLDAVATLGKNLARALGADIPLDIVAGASRANVRASHTVNVWWMNLRLVGAPLAACLALGAAQLGAMAALWRASWSRLAAS